MAIESTNSITMVVQPHVAQPIAAQGERPEKFSGTEFKRWHQKMILLTTLKPRFLSEEAPLCLKGRGTPREGGYGCMEGMTLSESFQVVAMIEKLPPLWKDFKNYLKHKREEMGLEDLIVRLRIEEDNRLSEMKFGRLQIEAKANLMEQNGTTSHKRKRVDYKPKKGKAKMTKGNCYNCGKPNHMAKDCRLPRKNQAHVSEVRSVPIYLGELNLSAVVFEANLVDNPREW
ncbi:UNVERIFIED_CONTAM: hypothetical protein Sradi_4421300 [Sesamum radiatum]|uniref:CCHC-type domain-containing protein n=1 Tax=Sesamum radiatum TaxID=300843 RepID=A0AAW2NPU0_SESRA